MTARVRTAAGLAAVAAVCLLGPSAESQPARVAAPRLEPVAETRLLMDALARPNFDALGQRLRDRPADAETWAFARGQALLLAETGNLLMIRPPKARAAQDGWLARAAELRAAGTKLATAAGSKDYVSARAGVAEVANACNRCHAEFRVAVRAVPFEPVRP
jgi:cytochrome c556